MAATNLVAFDPRGTDNCPRKLKLTTPSSKMGSAISARYSHSLGTSTMKSSAHCSTSLNLLPNNCFMKKLFLSNLHCSTYPFEMSLRENSFLLIISLNKLPVARRSILLRSNSIPTHWLMKRATVAGWSHSFRSSTAFCKKVSDEILCVFIECRFALPQCSRSRTVPRERISLYVRPRRQ